MLLWLTIGIAIGCTATALVLHFCTGRRTAPPTRAQEPIDLPAPPPPEPAAAQDGEDALAGAGSLADEPEAGRGVPYLDLAGTVGEEMATLTSAVQANAERLIDVMGVPEQIPCQAEELWRSVRRMHLLCRKLLCYGQAPQEGLDLAPVDAAALIAEIRRELRESTMATRSVEMSVAQSLPWVLADERALGDALRFLTDALVSLEPGTEGLTLSARTNVDAPEPWVQIEMEVTSRDSFHAEDISLERLELGYAAAGNLLHRMGCHLGLDHDPGRSATVFVSLPATSRPALDDTPHAHAPAQPHFYGGALIVESNPEIRGVIAQEIKSTGRSVFTCADDQSARSFLDATPERFELLVFGRGSTSNGERLIQDLLHGHEDMKVLLLDSGVPPLPLPDVSSGRLVVIHKPFGITELRESLQRLL